MRQFVRNAKRSWSLVEGDVVLGTRVIPKWYSQRAEITVANGHYVVKSRGMLSRNLAVLFGDVEIMYTKEKWSSTAIHAASETAPLIVMKRKTWFSRIYQLVDATGAVRVNLKRRFDWQDLGHTVEIIEEHGEPIDPLLLLFAAQVLEVQQQRAAAAT